MPAADPRRPADFGKEKDSWLDDRSGFASCIAIAAAVVATYSGTLRSPMFFDDIPSIVANPTIRHLGDLPSVFTPHSSAADACGVSGRPFVNLSLAIDYAIGGLNPWIYHVTNLFIHFGAACALFGILRHTFRKLPLFDSKFGAPSPTTAAFVTTLIWALHPLLTESISCIIQRTESLMGLCFLATLYCFIRHAEAGNRTSAWSILAVGCCLCGMASKEVMFTAPLVVLLYDSTYLCGSIGESIRRRGRLHLALFATWMLLAFLLAREGGSRGAAAGFSKGVTSWAYLLTQCKAVVLYLKLSLWPHPLVVDYGNGLVRELRQVWPEGLFLLTLLAGSLWAFLKTPRAGFVCLCFFAILAPSSSFVPLVTQTIAEHRMYLPLVCIAVGFTMALIRLGRQLTLPVCASVAVGLAVLTFVRNRDYASEVSIWRDTAAKQPDVFRVRNSYGMALLHTPGGSNEAVRELREAVRIRPDDPEAHSDLGLALMQVNGGLTEAIDEFKTALRLNPLLSGAHLNLGQALSGVPGRLDESVHEYQEAIRIEPQNAVAHFDLGSIWLSQPARLPEAISELRMAIDLDPALAIAHFNLAVAYLRYPARIADAQEELETALRLDPENVRIRQAVDAVRAARRNSPH